MYRVTLPGPVDGVRHIDVGALRGAITDDLALRDFTVNAIAARATDGALIDPHRGRDDLAAGVLRLVTADAVRNDPLRALRAVRFAAELGFTLEERSAAIVRRDAPLLARAAGERQRDELARVFETPVAAAMVRLADDLGLLDVVVPELAEGKGCAQPKEHHYDVFDHNVATVDVLDGILHQPDDGEEFRAARFHTVWDGLPDAADLWTRFEAPGPEGRTRRGLLKLVGLLHDVAKPRTKSRQPNGRIRFFGHSEAGAGMAAEILTRLRYTSREIKLAELLITDHLRPGQLANGSRLPTRRALYRFFRDLDDAAPDLLLLNLADHAAARGPAMPAEAWLGHIAYIRWILEQRHGDEALTSPPPARHRQRPDTRVGRGPWSAHRPPAGGRARGAGRGSGQDLRPGGAGAATGDWTRRCRAPSSALASSATPTPGNRAPGPAGRRPRAARTETTPETWARPPLPQLGDGRRARQGNGRCRPTHRWTSACA
ncbi:MAG: HD domain-containing protein [Dehalococcoidia bacterium]